MRHFDVIFFYFVMATICVFSHCSYASTVCGSDSIVEHRINPFHYDSHVSVAHNGTIHQCDELMFKILTDNTVEFVNYRDDSIVRIDSLIIPEYVIINDKCYKVVGIAEGALSRDFANLMGVPYYSDPDMSYFGPSYLFIPSSVSYISPGAFSGNMNLKTIVLSEGLDSIGEQAFWGSGISSLHIPSTVKMIKNGAFENCMSLQYITVSPENKTYDSRGDCNAIIESKIDYMSLTCSNTVFIDNIKQIRVTNNVSRVKLSKKNRCEGMTVATYTPEVINARRCCSLKCLTITFNHESEIRKVSLPDNLEYLLTSRIDIDRIKGRMMKKGGLFKKDEHYTETRSYNPEANLLQIKIERSSARNDGL